MPDFLICYQLQGEPSETYAELAAELKALGAEKIMTTLWVIHRENADPDFVRRAIEEITDVDGYPVIEDSDSLVVCRIPSSNGIAGSVRKGGRRTARMLDIRTVLQEVPD